MSCGATADCAKSFGGAGDVCSGTTTGGTVSEICILEYCLNSELDVVCDCERRKSSGELWCLCLRCLHCGVLQIADYDDKA